MAPDFRSITLNEGWEFKAERNGENPDDIWRPVKQIPTIRDPRIAFNAADPNPCRNTTWIYKLILPNLKRPISEDEKLVLAFDGLDTLATVKLNGEIILQSDNMFIAHRVDVTEKLRYLEKPVLTLEFEDAATRAEEIVREHPKHRWVGYNGDMSRLALRKAQYHWGWDWGPELVTCGPWRPIRLERYQARISGLRLDYSLSAAPKAVTGTISVTVEGAAATFVQLKVSLHDDIVLRERVAVDVHSRAKLDFLISKPKLWYPRGYGDQVLYDVVATIVLHDGGKGHQACQRTGFRTVELIQEDDDLGKSFYFRVNAIDVFCGGSNWIPGDSFTPNMPKEKYEGLLQAVVDGNQNMIRVWGGGIWEEDILYETCDKLGILVWQDFMFACGNYPVFPKFLNSVRHEAATNVRRLRHHPCIAIYTGNNEDHQIQEQLGLHYDYSDQDPQNWLKGDFPARYIYEKILPEVMARESPGTPYQPGSPWSGSGKLTSDPSQGDLHQWNVWHGTQEKYQLYEHLSGRFNSEFGMQAYPDTRTSKEFVAGKSHSASGDLDPQSRLFDFRNKALGHERRTAVYMAENFHTTSGLDSFTYTSQLCQAEALKYAFRGWRRLWGKDRACGGALIWQLNDCWPCISWSIIDYQLRTKPSYYAIARTLAPLAIGVRRHHRDWDTFNKPEPYPFDVWIVSNGLDVKEVTVEMRIISLASGEDVCDAVIWKDFKVDRNGTTDVHSGKIGDNWDDPQVIAVRVMMDGETVARDCDWPQPYKYYDLPKPGLKIKRRGKTLHVTAKKPVKGLMLSGPDGLRFSDNCLDVMPGDAQTITISLDRTEGMETLQLRSLGHSEKIVVD